MLILLDWVLNMVHQTLIDTRSRYANSNQVVIFGIISDSELEDSDDPSTFENTGRKRVLMLAKVDGTPETYHNGKIPIDSLYLPYLSEREILIDSIYLPYLSEREL